MTVDREDFLFVLKKLRDVRAWSVHTETDPFAFRQAMITVMEADTKAALERGVTQERLDEFDAGARLEIMKFLGEEERRGVAWPIKGGRACTSIEWLTLTELQGRLSGSPTKHVLAVWENGFRE